MKHALSSLWDVAANSRVLAGLARLAGNQAAAVLSRRLSSSSDPRCNGEERLIRQLAPRLRLAVDVGANVGEWARAVLAAAPACEVICFEPSSACQRILASLTPRVHVRGAAVSDRVGRASFAAEKNCGKSGALLEGYVNGLPHEIEDVAVTRLDAEFEHEPRPIDLVKIDTEGFDLHVLRGAAGLFRDHRISVVQFEYVAPFWHRQGSTLESALHLLREYEYEVWLLNRDGLHALDLGRWGRWLDYGNFVAARPDARPALAPLLAPRPL